MRNIIISQDFYIITINVHCIFRHTGNGAVIARCSQPEVGWLGWRSAEDEDLLKAISDACNYDRGPKTMLETNSVHSPSSNHSDEAVQAHTAINLLEKKVRILYYTIFVSILHFVLKNYK